MTCISPQETFEGINYDNLHLSENNKLLVLEPAYKNIPPATLRRMGKAVRIGVGAALELIGGGPVDGVIIGTANGGMEDCIKFLNQITSYHEGLLTPGNFVQSTANNIASQAAMLSANTGYNSTHVHRGLAFENAALDAAMLVKENPAKKYLLGGVDEISAYNYHIDCLGGWFNSAPASSRALYETGNKFSIAGEGAAMFQVDDQPNGALAAMKAMTTLHTLNENQLTNQLAEFLGSHLQPGEKIDLFLSGENGDPRLLHYYQACESVLGTGVTVARFKHMSGDYPTASSMALWLACHLLATQHLPDHMMKHRGETGMFKTVLIYNNYRERQHGFMLVGRDTFHP